MRAQQPRRCLFVSCLCFTLFVAGGRAAAQPAVAAEEELLWSLAEQRKHIEARELAEHVLRANPGSYAANFALGVVQHYGEGNLARSLYHFERARTLFEARWGTSRPERPGHWHAQILIEASWTAQDMERPLEQLAYLDAHDALYEPDYVAQHAWPLMKLDRFEEARRWARAALASSDEWQRKVARTALCAIEYEAGTREASYTSCLQAAQVVAQGYSDGGVELSNAALGALQLLRFDEAERLLREGADRDVEDYANPWSGLAGLYTRQGRVAEAVGALRQAQEYRMRRPAYLGQQDQAEMESHVATLLLLGGRAPDAARITSRALSRPDREGGDSGEAWQSIAGMALLDALAYRESAEMAAEEVTWQPFVASLAARARELSLRWEGWMSARKAAALLAQDSRLERTLRVGIPGGAAFLEAWLPEIAGVLGPGVVRAAIARARVVEPFAPVHAYLDAVDAEAAYLQSAPLAEVGRLGLRALRGLPAGEKLLASRVRAVLGAAASRAGRGGLADWSEVMHSDPGLVRRLGLAIPVRVRTDGSPLAIRAAALLEGSPRFAIPTRGTSFTVVLTSGEACLRDPSGAVLECAPRDGGNRGSIDEQARKLVRDFHRAAFGARVDLTQSDIQSLDGSTTSASGRGARRIESVIDSIMPPSIHR